MPVARSLRARVLVWVGVALTVLFTLTVFVLDLTYRQTIDRSRADLLEAQLLGLIALAEPDGNGQLTLPHETINPQFGVAESGLYAVLWDAAGKQIWASQSLVGRSFPPIDLPEPGMQRYVDVDIRDFPRLEALVMGVRWEFQDGQAARYTFGTAVALDRYEGQLRVFRRNVVTWFVGVEITMLVVVLGVLGWVLRPVRRLARQVREVEAGERTLLEGEYPTELVGLAHNLNALIDTERGRLERYRHTLDDLAHSLKTPLAALRTLLGQHKTQDATDATRAAMNHELERMDQLVSYQLRRARASGATGLGTEPVAVEEMIADLCNTLDKVYLSKQVRCEIDVLGEPTFVGDRGDLSEILGNLIENGYKYCRTRVQVTAWNEDARLVVTVEDDGPGMTPAAFALLLGRGTRADETVAGQGIGLAVVNETASLYGGSLSVATSELGGARVRLDLGRAGGPSLLGGERARDGR
jgi:two-component system sensor histidine kinase PhoQ